MIGMIHRVILVMRLTVVDLVTRPLVYGFMFCQNASAFLLVHSAVGRVLLAHFRLITGG